MRTDCVVCASLREEYSIGNAKILGKSIRLIKANILDQTIVEVDSLQPFAPDSFASFCDSKTWPDYINCLFRCTSCGMLFRLEAETYHGSGGSWEIDVESFTK